MVESDCPKSWIKNVQIVDIWAKKQKLDLHGVNYFKMPNGDLVLNLPKIKPYVIPAPDKLGRVKCKDGSFVMMQEALDTIYKLLLSKHQDSKYIWDLSLAKRSWGKSEASDKQIELIKRRCKSFDTEGLNKLQASQILNRIMFQRI